MMSSFMTNCASCNSQWYSSEMPCKNTRPSWNDVRDCIYRYSSGDFSADLESLPTTLCGCPDGFGFTSDQISDKDGGYASRWRCQTCDTRHYDTDFEPNRGIKCGDLTEVQQPDYDDVMEMFEKTWSRDSRMTTDYARMCSWMHIIRSAACISVESCDCTDFYDGGFVRRIIG